MVIFVFRLMSAHLKAGRKKHTVVRKQGLRFLTHPPNTVWCFRACDLLQAPLRAWRLTHVPRFTNVFRERHGL